MYRRAKRLITGGAVLALALSFAGCSDAKKEANPKVGETNAPKVGEKAPGTPGAAKGHSE